MDTIYLQLVLQDFTLKQLFAIHWFNNNLDESIQDRYSKILDLLRQTTGADLSDWTPLKIQQGIMAAEDMGFISRQQEKEMAQKLKSYLATEKIPNASIKPYTKMCCNRDLKITPGRNITVFGVISSYASKTMIGTCTECNKQYSHNFLLSDEEKIVTREAFSHNEIIYFGGDYAYDKPFIRLLTNSIMHLYSGFENFTKCFNATKHSSSASLTVDSSLSPMRVQDFWFLYNFIACTFFYTKTRAIKIPRKW